MYIHTPDLESLQVTNQTQLYIVLTECLTILQKLDASEQLIGGFQLVKKCRVISREFSLMH